MSKRYGFLLLPRYSLLDLGGALAVLRQANQLLGGRAIDTLLLSRDGRPVAAAGGEQLLISQALTATVVAIDGLFVIGDAPPQASDEPWLRQHLAVAGQRIAQARGVLGGIGGGALWWAQAGLLDGYRCSAPTTPGPPPAFGGALLSSRYCEIDRNRLSCAGGACTLDLMIQWLAQEYGEQLGRQLMAHFGLERLRGGDERTKPSGPAGTAASAKLAEAVALMEANLGEPLSTEDIAGLVGVSRRQLERLFKQHLDTLPSRWYLEQRLARARRLLQQSSQSILQIGLSCGFASGAHFSNAYRNCFGHTPRDERSSRAAAWRLAGANQRPAPAGATNADKEPT